MNYISNWFHFYETTESFEIHRKQGVIDPKSICFLKETGQIYTHNSLFGICKERFEQLELLVMQHDKLLKGLLGIEGSDVEETLLGNIKSIMDFLGEYLEGNTLKSVLEELKESLKGSADDSIVESVEQYIDEQLDNYIKKDITVTATKLEDSAEATAEYNKDTNTLTIGIPKGERGERGERGETGPAGPTGSAGTNGENGAQGPAGKVWKPSYNKDTGDLSWTLGEAGDTETIESVNIKGPKGDKGEPGTSGGEGTQGPTGPAGERGADGKVWKPNVDEAGQLTWTLGEAGEEQTIEPVNIKGPQGDRGEQGLAGPAGTEGAKGDKGDNGKVWKPTYNSDAGTISWELIEENEGDTIEAMNVRGPKGEDGSNGETGPAGVAGPEGPEGKPGKVYKPSVGEDGTITWTLQEESEGEGTVTSETKLVPEPNANNATKLCARKGNQWIPITEVKKVESLTNLPTNVYSIECTLNSDEADALSFDGTPTDGWECMIDIKNNHSSDITVNIPNGSSNGTWQCDASSITIPTNKIGCISVRYVHETYVVFAK